MRLVLILLFSLFFTTPVFADTSLEPLLNKVTLQLNAEQWVTTKTALVNVSINASMNNTALEKIHAQVLDKLNRLSDKGEWHLTSYDRSLDKSGLESVQIMAQSRLPDTELAGLRDKAKSISKPGETYAIDNIQFTPSDDEIRDANNALRANVYQQANAELARLNKIYPDQKYYLHNVNFMQDAMMPMAAQNMMLAKGSDNGGATRMSVGDKMRVSASVVLAANSDQILKVVQK